MDLLMLENLLEQEEQAEVEQVEQIMEMEQMDHKIQEAAVVEDHQILIMLMEEMEVKDNHLLHQLDLIHQYLVAQYQQ